MQSDSSRAKMRTYREKRYSKLDQRIVHGIEARIINRHLDRVVKPGDAVLDMPVGYGRFLGDLLGRSDNVVGSDHQMAMLELSRESHGAELPVVLNDCGALPFADASFDLVTCIRLFQHLHDPDLRRRTLTEIGRVTRRHAIVTTYLQSAFHRWLHDRRKKLKRLTYHTEASLAEDLAAAGLRVVSARHSIPGLHAQYILLLEKTDATATNGA